MLETCEKSAVGATPPFSRSFWRTQSGRTSSSSESDCVDCVNWGFGSGSGKISDSRSTSISDDGLLARILDADAGAVEGGSVGRRDGVGLSDMRDAERNEARRSRGLEGVVSASVGEEKFARRSGDFAGDVSGWVCEESGTWGDFDRCEVEGWTELSDMVYGRYVLRVAMCNTGRLVGELRRFLADDAATEKRGDWDGVDSGCV